MKITPPKVLLWPQSRSLRTKLIGGFVAIVALLVVVGSVATMSQVRLSANADKLIDLCPGIGKLASVGYMRLLEARRNEMGFLLQTREIGFNEAKARYVPLLQMHVADVREHLSAIRPLADDPEVNRLIGEIERALTRYETGFLGVVDLIGRLGHVETGIEGRFRDIIHEIETLLREHEEEQLLVDTLTLRRHEKDYLLRGQEKYVRSLKATVEQFKSHVSESGLAPAIKDRLTGLIDRYSSLFEEYVSTKSRILDATEEYRSAAHSVEPLVAQLFQWVDAHIDSSNRSVHHFAVRTIWTSAAGTAAALLMGMLVAFLVSRDIGRGIRESVGFAQRLADGDLHARLAVHGSDEFSVLGKAMNDMAESMLFAHLRLEQQRTELAALNDSLIKEIDRCNIAEEASLDAAQRLGSVLETASDAIICVDNLGKIILWNSAASQSFGYSADEILDQPLTHLVPERYAAAHQAAFDRAVAADAPRTAVRLRDVVARRKDGSEFPAEISVAPWKSQDGTFYTGIIRDVTDRKLAEKSREDLRRQLFQAQKTEALATLVGGIAHDFNNMLTVILGYSELLIETRNEGEQDYQDLQKIIRTAQDGARLVQSLLILDKKADVNPILLSLNRQIEHLDPLLSRTLPKSITLDLRPADDLAMISADPGRIDQVIMNLAINAMEAMPTGGRITIETGNRLLTEEECRSHPGMNPGEFVMLTVTDTGQGMDERTLERVFEPFFSTKQRDARKGTGLGLSVVRGIVEQHHGYIWCDSKPGEGTSFTIHFPALETNEEPLTEVKKAPGATGATILLVDDEELVRELAERILTRAGYTVLTAGNGKEALALYAKVRRVVSLVILDLIMPVMSGERCLEELQRIDPDLPVLIASGYSAEGQIEEALEKGARGFVTKPYEVNQMLKAVREVLTAS